jgi:hypothetical protein
LKYDLFLHYIFCLEVSWLSQTSEAYFKLIKYVHAVMETIAIYVVLDTSLILWCLKYENSSNVVPLYVHNFKYVAIYISLNYTLYRRVLQQWTDKKKMNKMKEISLLLYLNLSNTQYFTIWTFKLTTKTTILQHLIIINHGIWHCWDSNFKIINNPYTCDKYAFCYNTSQLHLWSVELKFQMLDWQFITGFPFTKIITP